MYPSGDSLQATAWLVVTTLLRWLYPSGDSLQATALLVVSKIRPAHSPCTHGLLPFLVPGRRLNNALDLRNRPWHEKREQANYSAIPGAVSGDDFVDWFAEVDFEAAAAGDFEAERVEA